ncbi:MAG: hypothetical protein DMF81_23060, partial [Acidobacteria bacterium]
MIPLVAGVLFSAATATSVPAPSFADVSRRADRARQGNHLEEAIRLYRQGVKLRPRWDEGWWYLATLLYETDRYPDARAAFRRFLALKPEAGPGWALRGLCDFRVADYQGALEHLDKGLALGVGGQPEILRVARYHQALLLVRAGQFELAIEPLTGLAPLDAPLALQLRERRPLLLGVFLATGLCVGPGQGEMHLGAVRGQPRRGLQLARPPLDLTPLDQRAAQRVVRGEEAGGQRHRPLAFRLRSRVVPLAQQLEGDLEVGIDRVGLQLGLAAQLGQAPLGIARQPRDPVRIMHPR